MSRLVAAAACLATLVACAAYADVAKGSVAAMLKNAREKPVFRHLPRFYTSDPAYDEFVNEYFMRHLSVDERGVYWGTGPTPGCVAQLWVIEWDSWFLPWINRAAMGLQRQHKNPTDVLLTALLNNSVDKYGYAYGAPLRPEPKNVTGGHVPTFGWPWPKYNTNTTVTRPTGWEFNDPADGSREEWAGRDITLELGYVDFSLVGRITGPHPEIMTPKFDVDVLHVPIIELDISYKTPSGEGADKLVEGLRIYWTTSDLPEFSEDKMVTVDFCSMPPKDSPECYAPYVSVAEARYPLYFPMYLHPKWGRDARRITGLKIVPVGQDAEGVTVSLNYVRATYDVRLSTSNAILINSTYNLFMWSGDEDFLRAMMPKLRRATIFLNEHLRGKKEGLLNFDWMVGKDGLGGPEPGHGQIGSYWDLLPAGRYDIESSTHYYAALRAMAELERAAKERGIQVPDVSVIGPDNKSRIVYRETPESLEALAARAKAQIERRFWDAETGRFIRNIDINGEMHDYGFVHFNLLALLYGIGTEEQRNSILSWLDGRVIPGDTSVGTDIYKWRFAPRTSTKRNESYYFWPWVAGMRKVPASARVQFGNQIQDGGAVPFTSFLELIARTRTGDQKQVDRAFERTKEIGEWFEDVKSAGGQGSEFYRAYYNGHPERGYQQGGGPPGGLGLDREFLSDSSLGTTFLLYAFLGVKPAGDRVLSVSPALPTGLDKIGVENVFYHGNYLTIEAGRDYVSFEGSRIAICDRLKAKVTFRHVPKRFNLYVGGRPCGKYERGEDGSIAVLVDLKPVRIEVRERSEGRPAGKPLSLLPSNPHYFQDANGKPVVLIGDYTWGTFSDTDFDYEAMFDSLKARGLNLARVWLWWGCERFPEKYSFLEAPAHIEPYLRTGPGNANDGRPKYDLTKFNPAFSDRLRDFCSAARKRGIYLQLQAFDAWMLKNKDLWKLHAYHRDNNINGVDGDPRNTGTGTDGEQGFCSLGNPKALEFQKAYVRKIVDTVNAFDNVYFEIANENFYNVHWELALCDYIKEYEKAKPKQHLTMPRDTPNHKGVVQTWDPGTVHSVILRKRSLKVPLIFDTDWEINDNDDEIRRAAWSAVVSGGHFSYMDDSMEFRTRPIPDKRAGLHEQIDHLAAFVRCIKPWEMTPDDGLVKAGSCFAMASSEELAAYLPNGGSVTLDLTKLEGTLKVRWYNPRTGRFGKEFAVEGTSADLQAPDTNDWALYVRKEGTK